MNTKVVHRRMVTGGIQIPNLVELFVLQTFSRSIHCTIVVDNIFFLKMIAIILQTSHTILLESDTPAWLRSDSPQKYMVMLEVVNYSNAAIKTTFYFFIAYRLYGRI